MRLAGIRSSESSHLFQALDLLKNSANSCEGCLSQAAGKQRSYGLNRMVCGLAPRADSRLKLSPKINIFLRVGCEIVALFCTEKRIPRDAPSRIPAFERGEKPK